MTMNEQAVASAAAILRGHIEDRTRLAQLPGACRPASRADGYAVQAELRRQAQEACAGWKIAATSAAGQAHIGVDGPLAGRLWRSRILADQAHVVLGDSSMRVIEAEFVFRLERPLPPRPGVYEVDEVMAAVGSLFVGMEVPDSRYENFVAVGAPQLIADNACAWLYVLSNEVTLPWRERDLRTQPVVARRNGEVAARGDGSAVLGDPRLALTWIANELARFDEGLKAGELVTTGTCIKPLEVAPGDRVRLEFGDLGAVSASFS